MEANGEREPAHPKGLGGLSGGEPVPGHEPERVPVVVAEPGEGGQNGFALGHLVGEVADAFSWILNGLQAHVQRLASGVRAELTRDDPSRHAEEPRPRVGRNLRQSSPGHQERLRGDVLGAFGVDSSQRIPQDRPEVPTVDLLETGLVLVVGHADHSPPGCH